MNGGGKEWYESRAVWGGVVAAASGIGAAFGIGMDEGVLVEALVALGGAVGGIVAVYGRLVAERPIRRIGE